MRRTDVDERRKPTIRDVAAYAEVSPMTVSRALRDDPRVSDERRQRVLAAVEALGYRRNEAARNLRLGRTSGLVGLVVTNLANPFYSEFAVGVDAVVSEHGLKMVLSNTDEKLQRERQIVDELAARGVDGVIVVPSGSQQSHLSAEATGEIPVVLGARPPTNLPLDCVLVDDFGGSREATAQLIADGHRRIGFLGLPPAVWTSAERFRGFCVALDEAGIALDEQYVRLHQRTIQAAEKAATELLTLPDPPTAFFCANSRNTLGAVRAINHNGRPTGLAGFDDVELADIFGVPLIVAAYDPRELGRRAAQLLLERMNDADTLSAGPPRRIVMPTTIVRYGTKPHR